MEDKPFYTSDWHIHSVASYDAHLHVADLVAQAEKQGLTEWGLTAIWRRMTAGTAQKKAMKNPASRDRSRSRFRWMPENWMRPAWSM